MSTADVCVYDSLIMSTAVQEAQREGRDIGAAGIGAAVAESTGDLVVGMVAEAKAKLAEAARHKGY